LGFTAKVSRSQDLALNVPTKLEGTASNNRTSRWVYETPCEVTIDLVALLEYSLLKLEKRVDNRTLVRVLLLRRYYELRNDELWKLVFDQASVD
jgi:hypothetical protein